MWRQEIVSAGNAVYYSERMLPTLSFSDATEWDADYAVIKNANFLETACNRMSDGEFSGNRRAEVFTCSGLLQRLGSLLRILGYEQ